MKLGDSLLEVIHPGMHPLLCSRFLLLASILICVLGATRSRALRSVESSSRRLWAFDIFLNIVLPWELRLVIA